MHMNIHILKVLHCDKEKKCRHEIMTLNPAFLTSFDIVFTLKVANCETIYH